MNRKIYLILILLFIVANFCFAEIKIPANQFASGVGVVPDNRYFESGIRLYGLYFPGYVLYQIPIDSSHQSIALDISFLNPRGQQMDVHIKNFGSRKVEPALRKENLGTEWLLWESTTRKDHWRSSRPQFLKLQEGNGIINYLSPDGNIEILLYADGGDPPNSDELFFIQQVMVTFPIYEEILKRVAHMDSVWVAGDILIAKGVGFHKGIPVNPAADKVSAERAATLDGYRNLAKAIWGISKTSSKEIVAGELKGVTQKEKKYLENNGVEVLLQMPLSLIE